MHGASQFVTTLLWRETRKRSAIDSLPGLAAHDTLSTLGSMYPPPPMETAPLPRGPSSSKLVKPERIRCEWL